MSFATVNSPPEWAMKSWYRDMSAEIGRGSTRVHPPSSITARTCSWGGSIAIRKHVFCRHLGKSRNCRKFTCFDQTYCEPSNSMFLPIFSQVPMVVKDEGASRGAAQRRVSTGG